MPDIGTPGFICRDAFQSAAARTLTSANNKMTIANGDGVSGNPTYTINEANFTELSHVSSGAGAPATTPGRVGLIYIDTTGGNAYIATGTASSADWEQIDAAGGSATDPSEYDYLNDGNKNTNYTPNFTANPIIEITLTGNVEIQAPTHTGIASGDAFSGVLIVNTSSHTLTFASGITNYDNLATIPASSRVEFVLSTYDQGTSWFVAPAPTASEIRNDSGVTGATVSAALDTLNSSFQPLLSSPADADYFTQRNSGNSALEYARKSLLFGAAIELTDGEVDLVDLPACVITGGKAWVAGGGTSATVNIKIAGTSITGLSALSATTSKPGSYTSATAANVAALGNALSVSLTSSSGTGRVEVRLQGYYKRVA